MSGSGSGSGCSSPAFEVSVSYVVHGEGYVLTSSEDLSPATVFSASSCSSAQAIRLSLLRSRRPSPRLTLEVINHCGNVGVAAARSHSPYVGLEVGLKVACRE